MDESIIQSAKSFIQHLFRNDAGGHDVSHTMRVYRNTLEIAASEPDCDANLAALAALLHDADDHKLFATEHNANARAFLEGEHVPADEIEAVCEIINTVSFSQNRGRRPDTLEGQIVQDADRLDAMGAVGIARTFAYGGSHGRPFEESIQHFHDKLLRLKDLMNTDKGRELAESRHAYLQEYLKEYAAEVQVRRIQYYETLLQKAEQILRNENNSYPELELYIRELDDYYTGPAWKEDLAADEAGMLPAGLRRGVLSEDGIYNVLQEYRERTLKG